MERERIRGEDRGIQRERRREGIRQVGGWEEGRREEEGGRRRNEAGYSLGLQNLRSSRSKAC